MLAALAAVTTRVELGPLVACTDFHNPAILAKRAATVDEISGGRFILGPRRRLERDGVPGLRHPVRPSDRPIRGGVHDHPTLLRDGSIDFDGTLLPGPRLRAVAAGTAAGWPAADDRVQRRRGCCGSRLRTSTLERLVRGHRQRAQPASPPCGQGRRRLPRSDATRPRSSGPLPSTFECRGGAGRTMGDSRLPRRSDRSKGHRKRWPTSFARTPRPGSGTSSWSSIRSPAPRSRDSASPFPALLACLLEFELRWNSVPST